MMSSLVSTLPTDDPMGNTLWFEFKGSREGGAVAVAFSFEPTEEELIGLFLFNKVARKDDDSRVIPECDLYGTKNPWEIWKEFHEDSNCKAFSRDNELYLFTTLKKKGRNHSRTDRRVGLGTWAAEDSPKRVFSVTQKGERVVGSKRRYRFEKRGSEHHGSWIMIEYSLNESLVQGVPNPNHFVLCKIKKNERLRAAAGKRRQLVLKDADAAIQQRNDGSEMEMADLFNGRFPELVIGEDEVLAFWNKISN